MLGALALEEKRLGKIWFVISRQMFGFLTTHQNVMRLSKYERIICVGKALENHQVQALPQHCHVHHYCPQYCATSTPLLNPSRDGDSALDSGNVLMSLILVVFNFQVKFGIIRHKLARCEISQTPP